MRGWRTASAVSLTVAALGACDVAPNLRLHNGVGTPLVIDVAKGDRQPERAHLEPGEAIRIWNIYGPDLRLTIGGCERRYELPRMDWNHPWSVPDGEGGTRPDYDFPYPLNVHLKTDFSLHLTPPDAKGLTSPATAAQAHGYPLRPVSSTCG